MIDHDSPVETIEANNHTFSIPRFRSSLRAWGTRYRRAFPWRTTTDPFHIMIAELMLRRTQARQVVSIYNDFITSYPDARTLAHAPAEAVARALYSLGLSWRVPAFQQIAQILADRYNGMVPRDYQALLHLPGIGDYVASAICCFAFGQAVPVIDTNTVRVIGRLFGIPTHAESRRRKPIRTLLRTLVDQEDPQAYNYALLDLAALVCTPVSPDCPKCPLLAFCATGQKQTACQTR